MAEIKLYPFQSDGIKKVNAAYEDGNRRVCLVVPCGGGKTVMAAYMIKESAQRGGKVMFLVHRKELIDQTAAIFKKYDIPFGIIAAGQRENFAAPVQIVSVQTLSQRISNKKIGDVFNPSFIVCDECHHILAKSYQLILEHYPNTQLLGLTATPLRMGGVTLHGAFDCLIVGASTAELIKAGHLAPFKYFSPEVGFDSAGLNERNHEYINAEIYARMNKRTIVGNIITHYQKLAAGKSAVCYCVNVVHSEQTAAAFNAAGIPAAHCDYQTRKYEREGIISRFRSGKIKVLCNVDLFGEGFDMPNIDVCILARPTKSLTLYIQQAMRCLRIDKNNPNKVGIIIDPVQNVTRFGQLDAVRKWSLEEPPPKVHSSDSSFEPRTDTETRKIPQKVAGDLQKTYSSDGKLPWKHTIEYFLQEAQAKGYERAWAAFRAIEYVRTYQDLLHIAHVMEYKEGWAYYRWCDLHKVTTDGR